MEPLNDVETQAWRAFLVLWRLGLPEFDRTLRTEGLIHLEYGILAVLREAPDQTMPAGEIAALAGVSSSRLSHRLRVMESRGDVTRCTSPLDGRGVLVTLTEKGDAKVARLADRHTADIRRVMFDPLTAQQTAALADALMTIARRLSDHPFLTPGDRVS